MRDILLALAIMVLPACTDDTSTQDAGISAPDVATTIDAPAVAADQSAPDAAKVPDAVDVDSAVMPDAVDVDSAVMPDAFGADSALVPDAAGVDSVVVPDTQATVTGGACVNPATPPIQPCVGWSTVRQSYCNTADPSQVIMVTCSGSDTQCMAHTVCAAGWHLCSGTEYLARGGKTVPQDPSIIRAWIGACGRDYTGADLVDGVCSSCAENEINVPWAMLWDCQGTQVGPGMADGTIGVVTCDQCLRLGQNTPLNGGYWSYYWASGIAGGSLCCLDSP